MPALQLLCCLTAAAAITPARPASQSSARASLASIARSDCNRRATSSCSRPRTASAAACGPTRGRLRLRPGLRGSIGSDGFETVLIGTRGAREAFLDGWKGRAARTASDWAHLLTFVDLFAFHPFRPLHPLHPLVACSVLFPCLGSLAHSMLIRTPTACRSESEHLDGQKTCTIRAHAKSA